MGNQLIKINFGRKDLETCLWSLLVLKSNVLGSSHVAMIYLLENYCCGKLGFPFLVSAMLKLSMLFSLDLAILSLYMYLVKTH